MLRPYLSIYYPLCLFLFLSGCICETEPSKYELNAQDKAFLTTSANLATLEIKLSKLAAYQGCEALQSLASDTRQYFTKAQETVNEISENTHYAVDAEVTDEQQSLVARLEEDAGSVFDTTYALLEINHFRQHVANLQKELRDGTEPSVVAHAKDFLPKLNAHLSKMETLYQKLR